MKGAGMSEVVSRPPNVPNGYSVQKMADGRYYPQLQRGDRNWQDTWEKGDPASQGGIRVVSYDTIEEAEQECWRHLRQTGRP
jgi:hypothetical protein